MDADGVAWLIGPMLLVTLLACAAGTIPLAPAEPPAAAAPFASICPSAGGDAGERALWHLDGRTLGFVTLDGALAEGHTFFAGEDPPHATTGFEVVARDGWVAAAAGRYVTPGSFDVELALFEPSGALAWTHREPDVSSLSLWLGADGTVVWDRGYPGAQASEPRLPGLRFTPDGTSTTLTGRPFGPAIDGAVPICSDTACAWEEGGATAGERAPSAWSVVARDRLVYPSADGLVVETPEERATIVLTGAAAPERVELASRADDWLLVTEGDRAWRVDLAAGVAAPVGATLPDGLRPFDAACGAVPPSIDDAGGVLFSLRDDVAAQVWRLDPDGSWRGVGERVSDVVWLHARGRGGSFLVAATGTPDTFCASEMPPAEGTLVGSSTQLVRPDVGAGLVYDGHPWGVGAAPFSVDGACALVDDGEPAVFDLATGARTAAPGAGGWLLRE